MRIAVCDDSAIDRAIVKKLLERYFTNKSVVYKIYEYSDGDSLIYEIEDEYSFDLIFLDIYMDDQLGIDTARRLREIGYCGDIVFLTATAEFAVDSYDVNASGYLLKPHSFEKLCAVMDKLLIEDKIAKYSIKQRNTIVNVPYSEILYVESCNSKCILHQEGGQSYTVYKKLDTIEEELGDPTRFLRCHQSYLVNMAHIDHMEAQCFVLTNGDCVIIRQRRLKELRAQYNQYLEKSR